MTNSIKIDKTQQQRNQAKQDYLTFKKYLLYRQAAISGTIPPHLLPTAEQSAIFAILQQETALLSEQDLLTIAATAEAKYNDICAQEQAELNEQADDEAQAIDNQLSIHSAPIPQSHTPQPYLDAIAPTDPNTNATLLGHIGTNRLVQYANDPQSTFSDSPIHKSEALPLTDHISAGSMRYREVVDAYVVDTGKTVYQEGEVFVPNGFVIEILYHNMDMEYASDISYSPTRPLTVADTYVDLHISEFDSPIRQSITVNPVEVTEPPQTALTKPSLRTHKEFPFTCSSGSGSVNTCSGRFTFSQLDVSVGAGSYSLSVFHIFNSHLSHDLALKEYPNYIGIGWKLDIQQYVKLIGDRIRHIDAMGNINTFLLESSRAINSASMRYTYRDINGSGTYFEVDKANSASSINVYILKDIAGNRMEFDSIGRLVRIISATNNNICKVISYDGIGRPAEMYDQRKPLRRICFAYNTNNLLDTVTTKEGSVVKHIVSCHYDASSRLIRLRETLQNVTNPTRSESRDLTIFTYDGYNCIHTVHNTADLSGLLLSCNSNLAVTSVKEGAVVNTQLPGTDFSATSTVTFGYSQYLTTVTDDQNIKIAYELDKQGNCVSVYELVSGHDEISSILPSPEGDSKLDDSSYDNVNGSNVLYISSSGAFEVDGSYKHHLADLSESEKPRIAEYLTSLQNEYIMFSAWVYVDSQALASSDKLRLFVKVANFVGSYDRLYFPVDKNKTCQWQYVAATLKVPNYTFAFQASRLQIGFAKDNSATTFYAKISDVRIMPLPGKTCFAKSDKNILDLTSVVINNAATVNLIQQMTAPDDNFITSLDIEATLMSRYYNNGNFTFFYNNKTKSIGAVNTIKFVAGSWNYTVNSTVGVASESNPVLYSATDIGATTVKQHRVYGTSAYIDYIKYNSITDSKRYELDGRLVFARDEYGITSEYTYDQYGNLIEQLTANGSLKMLQRYSYNDNDELVSFTDGLGRTRSVYADSYARPFSATSSTVDANGLYTNYAHDGLLRLCSVDKTISHLPYDANGNPIDGSTISPVTSTSRNNFSYDGNNRLSYISDLTTGYGLQYNNYGDLASISHNNNTILSRDYSYSSLGNSVDTVFGNDRSRHYIQHTDKYGRLADLTLDAGSGYPATQARWFYQDPKGANSSSARLTKIEDNLSRRDTTFAYERNGNLASYSVNCRALAQPIIYSQEAKSLGVNMNKKYWLHINTMGSYTKEVRYDNKLLNPRVVFVSDSGANTSTELIYDALGRVVTVKRIMDAANDTTYRTEQYRYGTYYYGAETYTTNAVSQIIRGNAAGQASTVYNISYDSNGNITGTEHNGAFAYNGNDNLIRHTAPGGAATSIQYDNRGNMTVKATGGSATTFAYANNSNRLTSITSPTTGKKIVVYDSIGNPTKYKVSSTLDPDNMSWTRGSLLNSYIGNGAATTYRYDLSGIRVGKSTVKNGISTATTMLTDGDKVMAEIRSDVGNIYYSYDVTGLNAIHYRDSSTSPITTDNYIVYKDPLGNVSEIYYKSKTLDMVLAAKYSYDAFGICTATAYSFVNNNGVTFSNTDPTHIAYVNPFRWKGYYYDTESALYYIAGRYYDPETGRFVNPKSVEQIISDSGTVGGINEYTLPHCNPVMLPSNCWDCNPSIALVGVSSSVDENPTQWKWWHWLLLGVGSAICITATAVLLAAALGAVSASTLVGATAIGAAKGALIYAGTGIITGAAGGSISAAIMGAKGADFWNIVGQSAATGFALGAVSGAVCGGIAGYNGWFQVRVAEFTHIGNTNEVILGNYINNSNYSYDAVARARSATYFGTNQTRWNQVRYMKGVGARGMWKINKMFLDQQLSAGRVFSLSCDYLTFSLSKEIGYLYYRGIIPYLI